MKMKKLLAVLLSGAMTLSLTACGGAATEDAAGAAEAAVEEAAPEAEAEVEGEAAADEALSYANIVLGESYTDLTTTITVFNQRTDLQQADYPGTTWDQYIAAFNEMYPNITVEVETDTNYADDALLRLQSGDWGDIMMIPAVDKSELSTYFLSFGDLETMQNEIRFATDWAYDGQCYGVPSTGAAQGLVYNKAVFEAAGVTELPKTPEEFMAALQAIKDNTDAIPLYTNYADGWPMGQWDAFLWGTATGDAFYKNNGIVHASNPFQDYGDGTHTYAVFKILYDAVAGGLTEEDYSTTDWEGCKGMINNGEIGCMALGSWAFTQMRDAGEHGDDIGYMPFPITIDGRQYSTAGSDYNFAINVNASEDNQKAAMVFVKWMTEESGFSYNEGGIPIDVTDAEFPSAYELFGEVGFVSNEPAAAGEEDFLNLLNADSELNLDNGGNTKVQEIIEHASMGDKTYDEIMTEWNEKWTAAQEANGIEIK